MKLISKHFLWPLLIVGLAWIFFLPALLGGFLEWDDKTLFIENPCYRGLSLSSWRWMCSTFLLGHWQPLTWLSCGMDYKIWGLNPHGWHATNLLLHALNAVLVYLLCLVLVGERKGRYAAATLATLFWAIHPLRVEAVAWLATRGYLMCTTFCLFTVLFYLRAVKHKRYPLAALLFFTLATFTKGIGMMMPLVLLIIDWLLLQRILSVRTAVCCIREKIPFFTLSLATGFAAFFAKQEEGGMTLLEDRSLWARIGQSAYNFWFYLWKTAVPMDLSPLYYRLPKPEISFLLLLATLLLFLLAFLWRRKRRWLLGSLAAYGLMIFPMLGITQSGVQVAADRFSYLSILPLSVLFAGALMRIQGVLRRSVLMVVGTTVFFLGTFTLNQTLLWQNDFVLWRHALEIDPLNSTANRNMAYASISAQMPEEGLAAMRRSIVASERIGNTDALGVACNSMGLVHLATGEHQLALDAFGRAIAISPNGAGGVFALHNRASLYFHIGRFEEALADVDAALKNPKLQCNERLIRLLLRLKIHKALSDEIGLASDLNAIKALDGISIQLRSKIYELITTKTTSVQLGK